MGEIDLNSLKSSRENAGLTQKEVEELLGMRSLSMRDYETGRLKLPVTVAIKLASLYKVTIDELVGNVIEEEKQQSKVLTHFSSLFVGNGFSIMFLDPVMRGLLEGHHDKYFDSSLFHLLTDDMSENKKKESIVKISKLLFSLASCDGKVSDSEIECVRYLLKEFDLKNKYKEISVIKEELYTFDELPKVFSKLEMRHFIIWMLFFFAKADGEITHQEIDYIEMCAENLLMNKANYLFIKEKFIKESV